MGKLRLTIASALICVLSCHIVDAQTVNDTVDSVSGPVRHRPKVGVVMSGGGAKGFAHIRALKAIEEAGIPIDYIAGTSMGSIIGGLYAVGYDPDMMEELTTHQDWGLIIMDKVPRRYMSLDNRYNKRNYWLNLPIIDGKVKIKNSFVDGVYVNMLLTRLTLPAYDRRDFNDLSVPFFCVATDMTTADPVIWESGSMARAIRSSMSIPFLFAPVDHGDRLLCDGGLLNNFPVRLMREKGADIVIGIDLEMEYIEKEKLDNSLKILERLIAVVSQHESNVAREQCDILIRPDIGKANMLSFNDFSPILNCGDEAGKAHEMELKALADSLQAIEPFEIKRPHVKPLDSIFITSVEVDGVGPKDIENIKSTFSEDLPKMFLVDEIEELIVRNYSTGYYSDMWYEVKPSDNGNTLVVHCKTSSYQTLGVSAHYDNNYRMQMLLNYSMMYVSKKFKRRTLNIDVNLADYPYLKVNYKLHPNNTFRLGTELTSMLLKIDKHAEDKTVTNMLSTQDNKLDLFVQVVPNRNQQFSIGLVGAYSCIKSKMSLENTVDPDIVDLSRYSASKIYKYDFYPHAYARYFFNNEDDADFTMSGWNIDVQAKYIFYKVGTDFNYPYFALKADVNRAFRIGSRHSIRLGAVGAMPLLVENLPWYYGIAVGGQSKMRYMDNLIPFTGIPFVGDIYDYIGFIKSSWYWNIFKGLYTQVNCDLGSLTDRMYNWFKDDSYVIGGGLTVGYKTPIGPVEIQFSKSNKFNGPLFFVNIGFWF